MGLQFPGFQRLLAIAALVVLAALAPGAQALAHPPTQAAPGHYVYLLEASRPRLLETLTASEAKAFEAHNRHLRKLRAEQRLVMAGSCKDGAFGLVVFLAADEAEARRLLAADPIVAAGVLKAKLHPFWPPMLAERPAAPAAFQPGQYKGPHGDLEIAAAGPGRIRLDLVTVVGPNAHYCALTGAIATVTGDRAIYRDGDCEVTLVAGPEALVMTQVGTCDCGVGATLAGEYRRK